MGGGYAWVTLATNNSYSLGALVLAHSLKKANTAHKLAVLITPAVSESMREQLQTVFNVVRMVDVLDSKDEAHLALMKRPDLGITFTKIHCWRLVEFEKCVFLDADTLVVRNCDELFEREEFSAAPDVSWPDCFNSGVFVYRPSIETFNKLLKFAVENRSFDGGDQGLLNQYFSDWATEDIKKHLPFVYNLTSVAVYSYIPAFKHYGAETRIVHFIGTGKPWLQQVDVATRTVSPSSGSEHLTPLLQQWWDLFCEKVHPNLDKNLESSNNGMSHSPVEACSNPLPVALIDDSHTPPLIESRTSYREKDDFRQYNLPYQPFDVKGSSGELLNEEFLLASVVSPTVLDVSLDEQQRRDENKMEEKSENNFRKEEDKRETEKKEEAPESNTSGNYVVHDPERVDEKGAENEEVGDLEQQQKQDQSSKSPFEYNSFFPDDTCVNNYLEENVKTYQPFDSHHHHHHQHIHESSNESDGSQKVEESIPLLPRFLTLPEDDRRQSGNTEPHSSRRDNQRENEHPQKDFPTERHMSPPKEPTQPRDDIRTEPIAEKRELTKSKSMPYLPCDVANIKPPPLPSQSIWKSQPDINTDFNRKYSMPKLKPILPKQNSFSKSMPSGVSKVTQYTEFLMSSEYKDPILPKDKVDFVEMHIRKEENMRRSKSDVDIRGRFGPLPYALSPEAKKPVTPKKIPFWHLENESYDLTQCKRQLGNKPKPVNTDHKKENIRSLPALKPIIPAKDIKSTVVKKRKSKKLSPGDERREKIFKRDPDIKRERKQMTKSTPRIVPTDKNRNNLDEILNRLREFSKNYQHFFGVAAEANKKTITCRNATVQTSKQGGDECTSSEIFKTISTPVSTSSKESQTLEDVPPGPAVDSSEFRQFRNYVKDQTKTSQKGLLNLQEILSETSKGKKEGLNISSGGDEKKGMENGSVSLVEIKSGTESLVLEECYSLKTQSAFKHSLKEYSNYESSSRVNDSKCSNRPSVLNHIENSTSTDVISNLTDFNSYSCGSKTVRSLNCAKDSSPLYGSSEVKAEDITEKTSQSHSIPRNTIPYSYKTKEKSDEMSEHSEEQELQRNGNKEETSNITSKECNKNSTKNFIKEDTQNQDIPDDEQGIVENSKECQNIEKEFLVAASEIFTKSKDIETKSLQEDVPSTGLQKQKREVQICPNTDTHNVKSTKASMNSKSEDGNHEHSGPTIKEKDGKSAEAEIPIRNNEQCDGDSRKSVKARTAPWGDNVVPNGNEKEKEKSEKDEKSKQEMKDSRVFFFGTAKEKLVKEYKNGTPSTGEVIVSDLVEEIIVKTASPHTPRSTLRKPRSRPKKVSENGLKKENRFDLPSNDSPDGIDRCTAKKTYDKKSMRGTPPPLVSTPRSGNSQTDSVEDPRNTSGIAGAIAQLSLDSGSQQSPESATASAAHQEYIRRQNWETGNMDYMGKDSFDNIWSKICQTIESKESEKLVAESPKPPEDISINTEKEEKLKEVAQPETTSLKCPEYIDTLPGEPAVGPVEDDEIFFSKPENKRTCLTNVAEEEEVETESSPSKAPSVVPGNVKLSDILQPGLSLVGNAQTECGKPQELKEEKSEKKEEKVEKGSETPASEAKTAEPETPQSAAVSADVKCQPSSPECKTVAICQPPILLPQAPPSGEQKQPEIKTTKPEEKAEECKTVAILSPSVFPGAPSAEKEKKEPKTEKKPDVKSEPIPLPPPDSPTVPEEAPEKLSSSDSLKDDSKQKKGVFTKILEMVGVAPKEKNGNEISKSVFYDTEGSAVVKKAEEPSTENIEVAQPAVEAQVSEEADKSKAKISEQETAVPPAESHEKKMILSLEVEEKKSDLKDSKETQETKAQESKHSDEAQEQKPPAKETEKVSAADGKSKKKQKPAQKPSRNSSSKDLNTPADSKDSAEKSTAQRKSPSPKLTMPQNPPETEITTPTPPPQPEASPKKNSALLKVDDSIPETPPVPEPPKEAVKGKESKELDILEKAKSEVESLLQDCREAEAKEGENSDLINTMKLMMAGEQAVKPTQEDVEELRVTSEEERKQHKGEVVSSKLSDQILKAIPPPRRKAISEASASTSAIPKAPAAPEQKNPPAESKTKTSKSSSIPVPPPRSRGKPTQPAPSKGKGKK